MSFGYVPDPLPARCLASVPRFEAADMASSARLVCFLLLLLSPSTAWLHGKPEPGLDNRYRSQSATEMLNRLWGAARERADDARAQRAQAERQGQVYSPTNADMFAGLMDYAKEKLDTPPLLRVEQNLLQLHKQVGLLATQVARLVRMDALDAVSAGKMTAEVQETLDALQSISNSSLHPVQAKRYTIIENKV